MKHLILATILSCLGLTSVMAQKGYLRGKVIDGETGEPLIGATVSKEGTTTGGVADFDGNYSVTLDEGTHNIVFRFVSYQTQTIQNVEIKAGEVTSLDITLAADVEQLEEIVVVANVEDVRKDTEAAVMMMQKKSANLLDGVSSQTFKRTGDSNLSGAIKRVTGVSVQGGKYVYVRGLGDRYTRTTLNGMSIPGLDPDRNDVQIDIFPTSVLENVIVYKTFTPDLPADFTGGVVDVETKSFPDEKTTSVSLGFGFNPDMHFNNDFVSYEGGSLDWLGFDDGTRELPFDPQTEIPLEVLNDPELENLTRSLDPTMATQRSRSFMNTSFSFNHGNQINKEKYTLGYSAVFNYQRKLEYYEDATLSSAYFKDANVSELGLDLQSINEGDFGRENSLWSALLTGALKKDNYEIGVNLFRTQNSVIESSDRVNRDIEETGQLIYDDVLTYSQRSVTTGMVNGKHNFDRLKLKWVNSFTHSRVYDPDFRITSIAEVPTNIEDSVEYSIAPGQGGTVNRFWRDLKEYNENLKVDATYELNDKNKIKAGLAGLVKWRTFDVYLYLLRSTEPRMEGNDPAILLQEENVWSPETESGTYLLGSFEPSNNYEARSQVFAGYLMNDIYLTEKLRAIYGVRLEKADMFYTGENRSGTEVFNDDKTLDELNLLPALNLVYNLTENSNVRTSYGRTLARPSFKEISVAQIVDPISKINFSGNLDLVQTTIDNFDLRYENFFGNGEMFSISGFYKKFDGHIELTRFEDPINEYTPRNIGGSYVYGVELEVRKNVNFIDGLSVGTNISLAESAVDTKEIIVNDQTGTTEYESRLAEAREGETVDDTRDMAGQAPYLVNAFINYADADRNTNVNLSYNVQGKNLAIVGIGQMPDIYNRPFHSLNLKVSRNLGVERNSKISFGIANILDDEKEMFFSNFGDVEEIFSLFEVGRTFSVSYAYTF